MTRPPLRAFACLLPVVLLSTGCDGSAPVTPMDPDPGPTFDLSWLEANRVPFRTTTPDGNVSDLEPLRAIVGDARVVSLGEATHGTREFFQMKHRVLEFLVREMGFTVFGIEASWAESNRLNEFVLTGEGDPAALLAGLGFWTWNTQEVLDMVLWMRAWNETAAPEARLHFTGFDAQLNHEALNEVTRFLERVDPGAIAILGPSYACWRTWGRASAYRSRPESFKEECRSGLTTMYELLAERRDAYEAASSVRDYARALQAARVLVQHEHVASGSWPEGAPNPRERYMAENAQWHLDHSAPGARMVLWAHNAHVMDVAPWMGLHLRQAWGDDMVIVGFSFHQGDLNALPLQGGTWGSVAPLTARPAQTSSYEHVLAQLEEARFLLDLRPLRSSPPASAAWLTVPRPFRMIGAGYDPDSDADYYLTLQLPSAFDVLIHVQETTPTRLLPFPEG